LQLQVANSPFDHEQVELLNRLLPQLNDGQKIWLSGYFSAVATLVPPVFATASSPAASGATLTGAPREGIEVTILVGSQTGNARGLSKKFAQKLEENGFGVTCASMSDFKPNTLKKVTHLLILVSTHGEGDPPDNAMAFYEFLHSRKAPRAENLQYAVLALGDSSYEFFCKTGKDFDERLEALGGKRICPRADCDLDFDEPAAEWFRQVLNGLPKVDSATAGALAPGTAPASYTPDSAIPEYSRSFPFMAEVLENINLNGRGSSQETRHIELSLEGSGLQYEPGDCLGICPRNDERLVDELIGRMSWDAGESVAVNGHGEQRSLREALLGHYEITVLTRPLLEKVAQWSGNAELTRLLIPENNAKLKEYIAGRDLLDLLQNFSLKGEAADMVKLLRKLPPRLYSIASSAKADPDSVHATVRAVRYPAHGRDRYGVCSIQCAERLQEGEKLPIYIHANPNFKLPGNPDTPLIMIGPGTGVAPFRSFLAEREETGAGGKSWLFYGDRQFRTDFLYQTDWQRWLKQGVLTRMNAAFSRDTERKVYVQHRMQEYSRELFRWLEDGSNVYVCGDEKHMAHDVHATLLQIIEQEGGKGSAEAAAYLADLQTSGRYQRDVY
jgi:sulfite reductase (NADPH) flavoprotein alpha-component